MKTSQVILHIFIFRLFLDILFDIIAMQHARTVRDKKRLYMVDKRDDYLGGKSLEDTAV